MITLTRPAYYSNFRNNQYCGLEDDDKSTILASNGDEYYEIDTAKIYIYNEASNEWILQPDDTTAIDTGLPPITSETTGHFLSNDGSVTKWQSIASKNFVINLTEQNQGQSYTADKTWVQIKAAFDGEENLVVRLNGSEMPLMSASMADNGNATLTFGYTELNDNDGNLVTRHIEYLHQGDDDSWTDVVYTGEFIKRAGDKMIGALRVADAPTYEDEAASKKYVDARVLKVMFSRHSTAGIVSDTDIATIDAAYIDDKIVIGEFSGDVYALTYSSATSCVFSNVSGTTSATITYSDDVWTQSTKTLYTTSGGQMDGDIDMNGRSILKAQKIHIDGQANLYLGAVVEKTGTTGARLTGVVGGGAAFVKPDKSAEYTTLSIAPPTQSTHAVTLGYLTDDILADAPASDGCIANKKYVDDQVATRVPLQTANQGQIKAYVQNGSKPDVCLVSDGGMALCLARYTAKGHLIDQTAPTENNHLANKQYVDTKVAQTGGNISGDLMVGGSLTINGTGSVLGAPTQNVDIVNKGYLDSSISDVIRKSSITVGANSSVNVPLSNGVYLLTVSDDMHGGLIFVSVYPSGQTINGLVDVNNWKCERMNSGSGVTLTNSAASAMIVYITSIGEGTYR